jgi:hypothetical protein
MECKVGKIDQILQLSEDSPKSVWKMQIESVKFVHYGNRHNMRMTTF